MRVQASNAEDAHWLMSRAGYKPVMEYCGGTEVAGAFCGGTLLHPCVPAAFATCTLGFELLLLSEGGGGEPRSMARARACGRGEVAVRAPALGASQTLLNRDHYEVYYSAMPTVAVARGVRMPLRRHGDEFEVMAGLGYYRAHGRTDDTMNLGGIKVRDVLCCADSAPPSHVCCLPARVAWCLEPVPGLAVARKEDQRDCVPTVNLFAVQVGSVELERVCVEHVACVDQAAAISAPEKGGGPERLHLFLVLGGLCVADAGGLAAECQDALRKHLNPLFRVQQVHVCDALPRNASNKVMRRLLRQRVMAGNATVSKL